jgi:signal transduction histidine kinase
MGISVGIRFAIKNNEISSTFEDLKNLESQFEFIFSESVDLYSYSLDVVQQQDLEKPITTRSLQEYISSTSILESDLFKLTNELKYIPIITNITEFTESARKNIDQEFDIVNPVFGNTTMFVPVSTNKTFYCPLSYMAPNQTEELYNFLGVDICNRPTWESLITKLNTNPNGTSVSSRNIVRLQEYVLDIGKNIYDKNNNRVAFAIHSFFLSEFVTNTFKRVFPRYTNTSIYLKLNNGDTDIFVSPGFDKSTKIYERHTEFFTFRNLKFNATFRYSREYLSNNTTNDDIIVLIVILLIFVLIDVGILASFFIFKRKKEKEVIYKLERQYSYVSKMINYVNHEIRNPLNSIIGMIELTRMELSSEENNENVLVSNLNTAYNSCILIKHIVNDVLDLRKLDRSLLDLYPERVIMKEFTKEFQKLISPKIQEHIHIHFSIDCKVNNLFVDKNRLNQILLNLCSNSFKFTTEGSIDINISYVSNTQEQVLFEVVDTGCGITKDKMELLFQPFAKVNNDAVSRQAGYGLGLYLCKMLVTLMQGTIQFTPNTNSTTGNGSIFAFILPKEYESNNPNNQIFQELSQG